MAAETPAAPLEKAVEEAREALGEYETLCPMGVRTGSRLYGALRAILAALDADKRLEEAEDALRTVAHLCGSEPAYYTREAKAVARRYFARREEKEVPE